MTADFPIPAGFALVPLEPTEAMIEAAKDERIACFKDTALRVGAALARIYKAAIAAAPPIAAVVGEPMPTCTYKCEAFPECGCVPEHAQKAIYALNHVLDCLLRDCPDEIQVSTLESAVASLYVIPEVVGEPQGAPQAVVGEASIGFSPMWLAPIDGTPVLLYLPTSGAKFAVGQFWEFTISESFWGDDESVPFTHTPVGWMSLHVLERLAAPAPSPATDPAAVVGVEATIDEDTKRLDWLEAHPSLVVYSRSMECWKMPGAFEASTAREAIDTVMKDMEGAQ